MTTKELVYNFISKRFPEDCNWTTGNCYYFAIILKARFSGELWYEPVENHFVCLIDNIFYDHDGEWKPTDNILRWSEFMLLDCLETSRIIRDCVH